MNNIVFLSNIPFNDTGASSSVYFQYLERLLKISSKLELVFINETIAENDIYLFSKILYFPNNLKCTILKESTTLSFYPWSRYFYIYRLFRKNIYFQKTFDNIIFFDSDIGFLNIKISGTNKILWLGDLSFELEWYNFIENNDRSFKGWSFMLFAFVNKVFFYKLSSKNFNKIVCCSLSAQYRLNRININAEFQTFPYPSRKSNREGILNSNFKKSRKFLFYGNLVGSGSASGLKFLFNEILPCAREIWGKDSFEIFIGGRTRLPKLYDPYIQLYSEIKYLGFISDLDSTLNDFTALLIPISLPLGNRTRVLDGLSFGIPVVGHKALKKGNPFLIDGINCLLSESGPEFVNKLNKICLDFKFRNKLISNGFSTYDLAYNPSNDHTIQLLN
jgi:hypothetical protein